MLFCVACKRYLIYCDRSYLREGINMKKGLSVLLIAAALFGFYGGATSLTDVLASKDYWEEQGEKSTADMNKLEDGLNQLKDNEKAYLDGQKQLADGEKKLADAEVQLADGEKQLADGRAELAQGYADYAAAPAKLAAGRAAVAKGESDLASLGTLIDGIESVLDNYPTFKNGYKQLRDGRVDAIKNPTDMSQLVAVLNAYAQYAGDANAKKTLQSLGVAQAAFADQDAGSFTNEQYEGFKDYLEKTKKALADGNTFLNGVKKNNNTVAGSFTSALNDAKKAAVPYATVMGAAKALQEALQSGDPDKIAKAKAAYDAAEDKYGTPADTATALNSKLAVCAGTASDATLANAVTLATNVFIGSKDPAQAQQVLNALSFAQDGLTVGEDGTNADKVTGYLTSVGTIPVALSGVNEGISGIQNTLLKDAKDNANLWLRGYTQLQTARTASDGLPYLADGVAQIVGGVYDSGNQALIAGMENAASAVGFKPQNFTPVATSQLTKDLGSKAWMENFYNDGNKVEKAFSAVLPQLKNKQEAGEQELEAGKRTLRQGEADYAAAPAKLAEGEAKLAKGEADLADGYKQYEQGKKDLADGKKKLAEYEDGEQQVRDGLATLMATKADPGLESILDRRNGDDKFDDEKGHLQLDEGLEAVDTGRGYQADSGELITKEVTNRAIGTAAGLGAAALAVLAAVLSFLKKNKGAAVSAVLAAVAGGIGAGVGFGAGEYYSDIAGSTVGNTPFIAAAVLAAVAVVFAIAHFTAQPEAKPEAK